MLSKLSLILILFYSGFAWSSGVPVCIRNSIEILPIVYFDVESKLDSFSIIERKRYCEDGLATVEEKPDLSLNILYPDNGTLNKVTIDENGGLIAGESYPATDFDYNQKFLMNGIPYLYSQTEKNILRWDSDLDAWEDIAATVGMPNGEFAETSFIIPNNVYFSLDDDSVGGIWKLTPSSTQKVSSKKFGEALITVAGNGIGDLVEENGEYSVNWWDNPNQPKKFGHMPGNVGYFRGNTNLDGTLYQFQGTNFLKIIWDANNTADDVEIPFPQGAQFFRGCFSSRLNILCAFILMDGTLSLYDFSDQRFNLDSQISSEDGFENSEVILSVLAVGKSRFITTRDGMTSSLYELNESGFHSIRSYTAIEVGQLAGTYFSRNNGVFYWIEPFNQHIDVFKAVIGGDLDYERIMKEPEPEQDNSKSAPVEEKSGSDSDSESIGPIGLYVLMILGALTLRRRDFI